MKAHTRTMDARGDYKLLTQFGSLLAFFLLLLFFLFDVCTRISCLVGRRPDVCIERVHSGLSGLRVWCGAGNVFVWELLLVVVNVLLYVDWFCACATT